MGNAVKMGKKKTAGILRTQSVGSAAAGAKCGNKIDWTQRIPAAEWWNRGGGRGDFYDAFCAFAFRPQAVRR